MMLSLFITTFVSLNVLATLTFFAACAISGKEAKNERDQNHGVQNSARPCRYTTQSMSTSAALHA